MRDEGAIKFKVYDRPREAVIRYVNSYERRPRAGRRPGERRLGFVSFKRDLTQSRGWSLRAGGSRHARVSCQIAESDVQSSNTLKSKKWIRIRSGAAVTALK